VTGGAAGDGSWIGPPATGGATIGLTAGFFATDCFFAAFFLTGLQTRLTRFVPFTRTRVQTTFAAFLGLGLTGAFTRLRSVARARARNEATQAARMFDADRAASTARRPSMLDGMAATSTPESTPQRLAAIRAQMSLLADYL
jgi:hypothetical protein